MSDHIHSQDFQQATISRCPHDGENPYAMVNLNLIRDESISPECRWMLIYLLSNKEGWKIRVTQIAQHVKKHMGKNKVYDLFNEAIKAGYIKREFKKNGNIRQSVIYYLSENPKFTEQNPKLKKSFRHPGFRDAENGYHKKEYKDPLDNNPKDKKEHIVSEPTVRLTTLFINRLREMNPKVLKPDIPKWQKVIERMINIDKRTPEEIEKIINFIYEEHKNPKKEFTWSKAVQSTEKLREHFASIWLQMNSVSPAKAKEALENNKFKIIKDNYEWTKQTVKSLQSKILSRPDVRIIVAENAVTASWQQGVQRHSLTIGYLEHGFREWFQNFLRKMDFI